MSYPADHAGVADHSHPFDGATPFSLPNPYGMREDQAMKETVDSVKQNGVAVPAIVRPRTEGGNENIAGHRRKLASQQAGYADMPCIVRNLTDDEAIIQLVDSNAQREDVLPSERAKAYKMRLEAIKRTAGRPWKDLSENAPNNSANLRSDDEVGTVDGRQRNSLFKHVNSKSKAKSVLRALNRRLYRPITKIIFAIGLYS